MKKMMMALSTIFLSAALFAGQYDDVQYLFRGLYNWTRDTTSYMSVDDYEFYNAIHAAGSLRDDINHKGSVKGYRRFVPYDVTDVVNPLTGRILKNRATIRFAQPTYQNSGDDTVYGYANLIEFTSPFTSEFSNDYTILVRYRHEGKICPESTQSCILDFGYGWGNNCGLWVSLKGADDNQFPHVALGKAFDTDFAAMTNSPAQRLSSGKWTDLVIARGGTSFAIYTQAEGGQICKQTATGSASSSQVSSWFRLGTGKANANISATNTVIATHDARNNFRGSFERVALWNRMLTDAEVEEAMADDFDEGDVLRFGLANDSEKEFTGTNYLSGASNPIAVTETDADQSTDWRHFANNLTPANPSATVNFRVEAGDFVRSRQLQIKLTSASAVSATLSATLNGTALLTNVSAAPGVTLTAEVTPSALRVGGNQLVFTRTDAGADPLFIDWFAIVGAADTGDYRGAKVADDIYADAWGWWKRPNDLNADGKMTADSYEFPNALYACDELKNHSIHQWQHHGYSTGVRIENQTVACPASGITLANEPCLYFTAPTWTKEGGGGRYGTACIYKNVFGITNTGNYAFMTRFKVKEWLAPSETPIAVEAFGVGYLWAEKCGVAAYLKGGSSDGENLAIKLSNGGTEKTLEGTLTADPSDRIATNKWVDIAIVVSNGYQRVYTFVEGGTRLVEQNVGTLTGGTPETSTLALGLRGTVGTSGADGNYPTQFRGWMHSCALWPRALNGDEVLLAIKYPHKPDLVTIGVADGTQREFNGVSVDSWTPPANGDYSAARPKELYGDTTYTVNFTIPDEQANRNQLFRLSTLSGSDPTAKISLELNGNVIVNYPTGGGPGITSFAANENGVYEIGVRRELIKSGASTLTVRYASGSYPVAIDSLSLGNGGSSIKVNSGSGLVFVIR